MALPSFIFDTSKGETPQTLARKREIADAILGRTRFGSAQTVGEGIGQLFTGIGMGMHNRRLNAADKAGQESASAAFNPILDAFSSRVGLDAGGFPAAPNPGDTTSMATMPAPDYASSRVAQAHDGGGFDVRQGLLDRGMPPHIADAFVMNFQDESGLDPGINERNPIVPGSRGGFGLSQWTGPRRRALEAYAAERGASIDDPNMQLDFLMTELAGPEASAWQAIQAAPDTGSAAAAIVNRFLRPSEQHRASREARYLRSGGAGVASSLTRAPINPDIPMAGGGLTPDALQQWVFANYAGPQQSGGAVDAVNTLGNAQPVGVAENESDILAQEQAMAGQDPQAFQPSPGTMPRLQPNALAQPAPPLGQPQTVQDMPVAPVQTAQAGGLPEMAGQNPQAIPAPQGPDLRMLMEAASNPWLNENQRAVVDMLLKQQMQAQQTQQAARQRMIAAQQAGIDPRFAGDDEVWKAAVGQQFRDPTADIQEYEYARQQGFPGSFTDFQTDKRRAGATNISNVVGGEGDAYLKKFWETMAGADAKSFTDAIDTGDQARRNRINLDRLSQLATSTPQGFEGAMIRTLGDYGIKTEGLDKVQAMESLISQLVPSQRPPGSGTISDKDLELYKSSLPRLINSPEGNQLILETMYAINDHDIAAAEIAQRVASGELKPADARKEMRQLPNPFDNWREQVDEVSGGSGSGAPSGIDPSDWEFMTPEERRLWQQ